MLNGSLAVWCDNIAGQVSGREPRLDLHFNLWLDLPGASSDVLDVGILLKEARQIEQLNLYVPARVSRESILDLSETLKDDLTLSAVFNSTLAVGNDCIVDGNRRGFEVRDGDRITFCIVCLDTADIDVESIQDDHDGSIIKFTKRMFESINRLEGRQYIRFRLELKGELKDLFREASNPNDAMLLSGFRSTDVIEFRVNERRNFGEGLRKKIKKVDSPKIEAIHYFLVRDMATELVRSHADFRKMRRLEPRLWDTYLRGLGTSAPERWVIYHWRAGGETNSVVDDFIALAFFAKPRYHLLSYILGIVALGAAGNSVQAIWTLSFNPEALGLYKICIQAFLLATSMLFLLGLFVYGQRDRVWLWFRDKLTHCGM